jgi:hypothetical protein
MALGDSENPLAEDPSDDNVLSAAAIFGETADAPSLSPRYIISQHSTPSRSSAC